jgi:two-component system, OmpR family, phosphate regulon sensor histidine kinase PhoR
MRAAETRITIVLVTATIITVGATYCLLFFGNGGLLPSKWTIARGVFLVAGAGLCAILGILALRQDMQRHRLRLFQSAREWILAPGEPARAPDDSDIHPFIAPLREKIEALSTRADSLQVQKKNLEIQLRLADAQRRQSQIMIHGISDAVIITDAFDELLQANPAAAALFKFDAAAGARKPIAGLLASAGNRLAADISDLRQNHARINRRAGDYIIDVDGVSRTFSVTLSCVMDNTDQLSGVVTMLHDRTRENEIAKMKTDFVSHVSHELRTPLSSIKAYAELLVDGEATDDKTRSEFYHIIQAEADRLSRLIDNILNISRIESGMTKINKKPVALNGILKQVLEVAMPSARDKNITLVDQVTPVFFSIDADRDMIYQAALNLVSNAIKYTPAGGTVKIGLNEADNEVTVLVTDTGVGIPPEAMKHLFEKFFRVEQHKSLAKGSGLGLNLTRQIIEGIHKGRMIVTSEYGKGSTFGFALPIAA